MGSIPEHPDFKAELRRRVINLELLHRLRRSRALNAMSPGMRRCYDLVPVLLHCNDPRLPGYHRGPVLYGIDEFTLSLTQRDWLRRRGMTADPDDLPPGCGILALYAMGSTSSVGQGPNSDLDIWVCISHHAPRDKVAGLVEKCHLLSELARVRGCELNLFVTTDNRFISNSPDRLDADNCGSAQNLILLDEFYRSAFKICGRSIVWYVISTAEELSDYNGAVERVLGADLAGRSRWFDLGPVVHASPAEYFGSALWLLYKSIEKPFKAMIKIMLMETYSHSYPRASLLSSELKDRLLSAPITELYPDRAPLEAFDAYFAMFEKVSAYLSESGDVDRLHLVRVCFYLKLNEDLAELSSHALVQERRALLAHLVRLWGWDEHRVSVLEQRTGFDPELLQSTSRALLTSFVKTYSHLLHFSVFHGIEYAITSDDVEVLSRKLSTAYDLYPGKLSLLPQLRSVSQELSDVTLVRTGPHTLCHQGWHLYHGTPADSRLMEKSVLYCADTLAEAVAWGTLNHMITPETRCHLRGSVDTPDPLAVTDLVLELRASFEDLMAIKPGDEILLQPPQIARALIVLNFEPEPMEAGSFWLDAVPGGNTLALGHNRICLVRSVELIFCNSWGEFVIMRFEDGARGLAELMATLLGMSQGVENNLAAAVTVKTCSRGHGELISSDVQHILNGILNCYHRPEREFRFALGSEDYRASEDPERGIKIRQLHTGTGGADGESVVDPRGLRPEFSLQVPPLVEHYATTGLIQYFFAPRHSGWDIYILDERNDLRIFRNYHGGRSALVNAINRFHTRQNESARLHGAQFNLPQYFVLSDDLRRVHPFTIRNAAGEA